MRRRFQLRNLDGGGERGPWMSYLPERMYWVEFHVVGSYHTSRVRPRDESAWSLEVPRDGGEWQPVPPEEAGAAVDASRPGFVELAVRQERFWEGGEGRQVRLAGRWGFERVVTEPFILAP